MTVVHLSAGKASRSAPAPVPAAFASQAQPLSAAARAGRGVEPAALERVETTLHKTLSATLERDVRREVERKLREALTSRRVRTTIQSAMYDDVVLERERLGGR